MFDQHPKLRILIADDASEVRRDLSGLLRIVGDYEVVGDAADGRAACRQALELRPNVVLMDLEMPALDGFAAATFIKSALDDCRLVALTVHADDLTRRRACASGFDAFVVKGAPLVELLGAIGSLATHTSR